MNPSDKNSLSNHYIINILFSKNKKNKYSIWYPRKTVSYAAFWTLTVQFSHYCSFRVPNNKENNQESNNQKNPIPFFPTFFIGKTKKKNKNLKPIPEKTEDKTVSEDSLTPSFPPPLEALK